MTGAADTPLPRDARVRPTESQAHNPYVGPRAFEQSESEFFFGRDEEVEILAGQVLARRASLVFSPSGAGKSSLIHAGLIPELTRQEAVGRGPRMHTYRKMRVLGVASVGGGIPPGIERPIANVYVYRALLSLQLETDHARLTSMTLADALAPFLGSVEPTGTQPGQLPDLELPALLIFDQFEELFTWDPTRHQEREDFFRQVNQALEAYPSLHVLFSMREDYIAELTPFAALLPEQLRPRFRLEFLREEAACLAIQQPAGRVGVEFTGAAASRLVDDLRRVRVQQRHGSVEEQAGTYIEPVQLQVVCRGLWEKLPAGSTKIDVDDVEAAGDVDRALAEFYRERVKTIAADTGISERAIRRWFDRHLITKQGIRGEVLQGPEQSEGLDNRAISMLVNAHLVRAEKRRGATWFELAHDRLIEPVRADNAAWREANLSPLQRQAALWAEQGRSESLLFQGPALAEAEAWLAAHHGEPAELEMAFVDQSKKAHRLRSAKRLRFMLLAAGIVVVLLSALVILAFEQRAKAVTAGQLAEQERAIAVRAEREAKMAYQTAEAERQAAVDARATAESGLSSALTYLEVSQARSGTIQALEATNQALGDRLTPTASMTPLQPTETSAMPSGTPRPSPLPTRTPVPIFPLLPTPDQRATATAEAATAQAIEKQLIQVRATQTAVARCPFEPQGEFSQIWQVGEIRSRLGCPKQASPSRSFFAEQPFENGYMYWWESPELFIVIVGKDMGTWDLFRQEDIFWPWNAGVSCPAQPPPGLYQPVRGFGSLWCANPDFRAQVGFATAKEKGVEDIPIQEFDRGYIMYDGSHALYLLFGDDGRYVRDMVYVPGGKFLMGAPLGQGEADEHPQSPVALTGFWLDRFEVTNADYRQCAAQGRCAAPHRQNGAPQSNSATRENYFTDPRYDRFPVIFVSWSDAQDYCRWAGKRLPTEAEWEWAAKGPAAATYPWGDQLPTPRVANYEEIHGDTQPVGTYDPNALGLYDMAGNVWEWTNSRYTAYPYLADDGREDPGAAGRRVLRGGSWRDAPDSLRTTNRDVGTEPDFPLDNVGFRCVSSTP